MSPRRLAGVVSVAGALLVSVLLAVPNGGADALPTIKQAVPGGPTNAQPATDKMTAAYAASYARQGSRISLANGLPNGRSIVGACTGGPKLWRCPVKAVAADAACTTQMWLWSDADNVYYEFHHLRCLAPDQH